MRRVRPPHVSRARPGSREILPRLSLAIAVPLIMVLGIGAVLPSHREARGGVEPSGQPAIETVSHVTASDDVNEMPTKSATDVRKGGEQSKKRSTRKKHRGEARKAGDAANERREAEQQPERRVVVPHTPAPTTAPTTPPPATPAPATSPAVASRVVVPALGIDLPVVAGNLKVAGNPPRYPLCDVAQYLTSFSQPGSGRTTYLYAHAREGMFLPLLNESLRDDGAAMIGMLVEVHTSGPIWYVYEIFEVKRHAIDLSLAKDVPPGEERLVLQTSEGPSGTVPKLQVAALLVETRASSGGDNAASPRPRVCN